MHLVTTEQLRKNLTKRVTKDLLTRWCYSGMKFTRDSDYFSGDFFVFAEYVCDFKTLRVSLKNFGSGKFDVIAENVFENENAIDECVRWVVETLMEYHDQTQKRIMPFLAGKIAYEKALKGSSK